MSYVCLLWMKMGQIGQSWRAKYRCEACGQGPPLELHHKTYDRLGRERIADLELLCRGCHERADSERERRGQIKAAATLYEARLEGWATRKYGEDWRSFLDEELVIEEFDAWVEEK